jgi:hypothetical protein
MKSSAAIARFVLPVAMGAGRPQRARHRSAPQAPGASEPRAGARMFAVVQQSERQPEHAPRRALDIAAFQEPTMGARPGVAAVSQSAGEIGGGCEAFEILGGERSVRVRCRQIGTRVGPRLAARTRGGPARELHSRLIVEQLPND